MRSTSSLAPPWRGPLSVAIAATTAACRSASVATATRAAKVEALNSWSACSVSATSITRATSSLGSRPSSSRSTYAACEPPGGAVTGARPERRRAPRVGPLAAPEQRGDLLERHHARQLADLVAAIEEPARRAVDGADGRARGDHVLESRLPARVHGRPPGGSSSLSLAASLIIHDLY